MQAQPIIMQVTEYQQSIQYKTQIQPQLSQQYFIQNYIMQENNISIQNNEQQQQYNQLYNQEIPQSTPPIQQQQNQQNLIKEEDDDYQAYQKHVEQQKEQAQLMKQKYISSYYEKSDKIKANNQNINLNINKKPQINNESDNYKRKEQLEDKNNYKYQNDSTRKKINLKSRSRSRSQRHSSKQYESLQKMQNESKINRYYRKSRSKSRSRSRSHRRSHNDYSNNHHYNCRQQSPKQHYHQSNKFHSGTKTTSYKSQQGYQDKIHKNSLNPFNNNILVNSSGYKKIKEEDIDNQNSNNEFVDDFQKKLQNNSQQKNQILLPFQPQIIPKLYNIALNKSLPIYNNMIKIIEMIENNQVTIISGETGCGKSTQVPQYIYFYNQLLRRQIRIVISQPRRIASLNLAMRVAYELNRDVGDLVGYQIALDSTINDSTAIIYMTTGLLMQRLVHDKDFLQKFNYIILDEVHERDIDSDFIMVTLKHLLKESNTRLILMSATIDNELFSKYFAADQIQSFLSQENYFELQMRKQQNSIAKIWDSNKNNEKQQIKQEEIEKNNINKIQQKHRKDQASPSSSKSKNELDQMADCKDDKYQPFLNAKYPVKVVKLDQQQRQYKISEYFLDNLLEYFNIPKYKGFSNENKSQIKSEISQLTSNSEKINFSIDRPQLYLELVQLSFRLIEKIQDYRNPIQSMSKSAQGSILIFLPGLNEIYGYIDKLIEYFSPQNKSEKQEVEQQGIDKQQQNIKQQSMSSLLDNFEIIPLHSTLSSSHAEALFSQKLVGRRKIIIATNIAESSITVPDVIYVIDFCLVKQINYDIKYKMEHLELNWASKASCQQRMGRTGRVQDGYCFHLLPKFFYDNILPKHTSPEMRRCSLDRVILKIKILNENESYGWIFEDPAEVLGRAIQPPELESIKASIKNLLTAGALQVVIKREFKALRITDIGRIINNIPCDIHLSKLCLMGFLFGCLDECITIACILQQQKSFFTYSTKSTCQDIAEFYEQIVKSSYGTSSDHICMMNMFYEWRQFVLSQSEDPDFWVVQSHIFQQQFNQLQNDDNQLQKQKVNQLTSSYLKNRQKLFLEKRHISQQERKWCQEHFMDPMTLREVDILKNEIIYRLKKLGFLEQAFDRKALNGFQQDPTYYYLCIQIALASTFYRTFIKCQISTCDDKLQKKIKNLEQVHKINTQNILIVNSHVLTVKSSNKNTSQQEIENKLKDQWIQIFAKIKFGPVKDIIFNYYETLIHFHNLVSDHFIKKILYIHSCDQERKVYRNTYFENKNQVCKEKQVIDDLGDIDYLHICKTNDLLMSISITIDTYSLNKFVFSKQNDKKYLITSDYQERGSVKYCRYTSILPQACPYISTLIYLMFSSFLKIKPTRMNNRYDKIKIEGQAEIFLDYLLTDYEINQINNLRDIMRKNLTIQGFKQKPNENIMKLINEIIFIKRYPIIIGDSWEDIYKTQVLNQQQQLYIPLIKDKQKEYCKQFFAPIEKQKIDNNLITSSNNMQLHEYLYKYNEWKKKVLFQFNQMINFSNASEALIACEKCGQILTSARNIHNIENNVRVLDIDLQQLEEISLEIRDQFIYHITSNYQGTNFKVYGCKQMHPFAFFPDSYSLFLNQQSKLTIIYPDNTQEQFNFFKFNISSLLIQERKSLEKKLNVPIDIQCYPCDGIQFKNLQDFRNHIKTVDHLENIVSFQNSIIKNLQPI